jgi:hypothetical protein
MLEAPDRRGLDVFGRENAEGELVREFSRDLRKERLVTGG